MKKVYYNPTDDSIAVADHHSIEYANKLLTENELYTSNSQVVLAVRVMVHKGILNHKEVEIYFEDKILPVYSNGGIAKWYEGFCDVDENLLFELI